MKLEKRIELCDSMTPLESEIASYILNNKDAVTKLKIQELADILFISKSSIDSGNLKITNLDRLIFTKNGEFTI